MAFFPEYGEKLITPIVYPDSEEAEELDGLNGLYNLEGFFPCPKPLIMNSPTDQFWPITEYEQLADIFDDIHSIFSKMIITTRAIRTRLIYDASIPGLKAAISEMAESDAIGVNNLTQALQASGGDLRAVAQYLPTEALVASLQQYYTALEQRLGQVFRLAGVGDMQQGQSVDNSGKTLGERQMEEKYANNQLYEPQSKMSEFVKTAISSW